MTGANICFRPLTFHFTHDPKMRMTGVGHGTYIKTLVSATSATRAAGPYMTFQDDGQFPTDAESLCISFRCQQIEMR